MKLRFGLPAVFFFFLLFAACPLAILALTAFTGKPPHVLARLTRGEPAALAGEIVRQATTAHLADLFRIKRYRKAAKNTLQLGLVVATLTTLLALPVSFGFARRGFSSRKILGLAALLPLAFHAYLFALAIILFFGPKGLCVKAFGFSPFDPFSFTGLVIAQIAAFLPLAVLSQAPALALYQSGWDQAARTLGANSFYRVRHVWLPLNAAALAAGWVFVAIRSMSDFVTPMLLVSTRYRLLVLEAWRDLAGSNWWPGAAALSLEMLAISAVFLYFERRWAAQSGDLVQVPLGENLPEASSACAGKIFSGALITALVLLPAAGALIIGLVSLGGLGSSSLSLSYYREVAPELIKGLGVSLLLGILVSGLCLLGALVAAGPQEKPSWMRRWVFALSGFAFAIPSVIYAISLIGVFSRPPLFLHFTPTLVVLALVATRMNYALKITAAAWNRLGERWQDPAAACGASGPFAFRWATLPYLKGALAASAALIFISSLQDVAIAILIAPPRFYPLSLLIARNVADGLLPQAGALAMVLMLVLMLPVIRAVRLIGQTDINN